ncbi:MAG: hypothetical protein M1817_001105 [Caeruleum heppii]|nr:MAG: hypothetical protein M1817_001105 [Caeruleum heppii]
MIDSYWAWDLDALDPARSPVFDGSEFSMSGNGRKVNKSGVTLRMGSYEPIHLPPGTGGGCVRTGPFKHMTVNLGPVSLDGTSNPRGDGMGYNPRCLKRDLNAYISSRWTQSRDIDRLLSTSKDIWTFQMAMQGVPGSGELGVHGGGHYTWGGDPGGDLYTSPGDPVFYLHHAQIDRLWAVWQGQDVEGRREAISGTSTFLDVPPSANVTLEDHIDLGVVGRRRSISSLMSTSGGPFCYRYA